MMAHKTTIRTPTTRDLIWLVITMVGVWGASDYAGFKYEVAFLMGLSAATISLVGLMYGNARRHQRFWIVIGLYSAGHVLFFIKYSGHWMPHSKFAATPIFSVDFLAMALLFPKLSGVKFDDE